MTEETRPLRVLKEIERQAREDHDVYAAKEYKALYGTLSNLLHDVLALDDLTLRHTAQYLTMRLLLNGYARVS